MSTTLIRNGHLLTMDPTHGEIARADVLIDGTRISQIGVDLDTTAIDTVIDAADHLVVPGFVDAHRHMWQTQLRGRMANATLVDYAALIRGVYSACYEPEDVYIGILTGYLDALNAGTTTLIDHCHIMNSAAHTDAAIRAFRDSGAGGVFCYGLFPNPERGKPDDAARILTPPQRMWDDARHIRSTHFRPENTERVRWGMALTEAEFFPIEYSLREIELARELGSHKISAHAGFGESSRHTRYVERLAAAGALDSDLLLVHGWSLSDHELELMVRHGTTLAVTPETELQMGMGFPALARFAELGGRAGLGIDIVSNQSSDMFTQMRLALQTSRGYDNDRLARRRLFPAHLRMTTEDILKSATIDGAHALGLGHEVGSLTVGKRADLLLIRKRDINMAPVNDAAAAVVLYANTGNIDTVIADGVIRKRHGQLTHPNLDDLVDQLQESTTRVLMRANEFDLAERMHFVRQIFPTDRKSSIEQRLAAKVFRTKAAAPLHDRLIRYLIKRTRIDG